MSQYVVLNGQTFKIPDSTVDTNDFVGTLDDWANISGWIATANPLIGGNSPTLIDVTGSPYFADPTGVLDSSPAWNAALAQAKANAGTDGAIVIVPQGTYSWDSKVSASNIEGVRILGYGATDSVIIQPTSNLVGETLLEFTNARFCTVENIRFKGVSGEADCAVKFHTENVVGGRVSTRNSLINVRVGSDGLDGFTKGVRMTCGGVVGGADDINNDLHRFEGCSFYNITEDAISIEHNNSLCHDIQDCNFGNVGVPVNAHNGSFEMHGGFMVATDALWKIGDGSNYVAYHACLMNGVQAENKTAAEAPKTIEISGNEAKAYIVGCELLGGNSAPTNMIDITGDDVELRVSTTWLGYGQPDQTMSATGDGVSVTFDHCHLGFTDMVWGAGGGILRMTGNFHEPGVVTETMDPTGLIFQMGDDGAQYDPDDVRGVHNFDGSLTTDGNITQSNSSERALLQQRSGSVGGRTSPIFYLGRIDGGVSGTTPRWRILYSDNAIVERPAVEVNYQGLVTSVLDGTRRHNFEGKLNSSDSHPTVRLTSTPAPMLSLGDDGSSAPDVHVKRTGSSQGGLIAGSTTTMTWDADSVDTGYDVNQSSSSERGVRQNRTGTIGTQTNPRYEIGRIDVGPDGGPRWRLLYQDDAVSEKNVAYIDHLSRIVSVGNNTRRAHFRAYLNNNDAAALLELTGDPAAQLALGNGGSDALDVFVKRSGAAEGSLMAAASPVAALKWTSTQVSLPSGIKLSAGRTDISGTPGDGTVNEISGLAAFASGGAATITISNNKVSATSFVFAMLQESNATCTSVLRCVPGSGTFDIVANAGATVAACKVAFWVLN